MTEGPRAQFTHLVEVAGRNAKVQVHVFAHADGRLQVAGTSCWWAEDPEQPLPPVVEPTDPPAPSEPQA